MESREDTIRRSEGIREIKFTHNYSKFMDLKLPFNAELLQCFKIHYRDLSRDFKEYDTELNEFPYDYYKLPKTDLIVLLLRSGLRIMTTIRRYTPEKWRYYKSLEGEPVRMVKP